MKTCMKNNGRKKKNKPNNNNKHLIDFMSKK